MSHSDKNYLSFDDVISSLKSRSAAAAHEVYGITFTGIHEGHIQIKRPDDAGPVVFDVTMLAQRRTQNRQQSTSFGENGWQGLDFNRPRQTAPSPSETLEDFLKRPGVKVSAQQAEQFLQQIYFQHYGAPLVISPLEEEISARVSSEGGSKRGPKKEPDFEALLDDAVDELINGDEVFETQKHFDNWIDQRAMDHEMKSPGRTKLQEMYSAARRRFASWQQRNSKDVEGL